MLNIMIIPHYIGDARYIIKEHLKLLAKYNRIRKEYSCEIKLREDGFWMLIYDPILE